MAFAGRIDTAVAAVERPVPPIREGEALGEDADALDHADIDRDSGRTAEREAPAERGPGEGPADGDEALWNGLELGSGLAVQKLARPSVPAVATADESRQQHEENPCTSQPVQPHRPTPP